MRLVRCVGGAIRPRYISCAMHSRTNQRLTIGVDSSSIATAMSRPGMVALSQYYSAIAVTMPMTTLTNMGMFSVFEPSGPLYVPYKFNIEV